MEQILFILSKIALVACLAAMAYEMISTAGVSEFPDYD